MLAELRLFALGGALAATACAAPTRASPDMPPPDPRSMIRLLTPARAPAAASLSDFAWLQGRWVGQMPDGPVEQIWLSPAAGQLPSFVRAESTTGISFYEISVLRQTGSSVTLRVKHFTSDLVGWEAREAFIDRPLVARTGDHFFFDGITIARTGRDALTVYFLVRDGESERQTIVVPFERR